MHECVGVGVRSHALSLSLPLSLVQAMDGELYDKARNVYMIYAQIDADAANLVKAEFEDLREQAYLVSIASSCDHMTHHVIIVDYMTHHAHDPLANHTTSHIASHDTSHDPLANHTSSHIASHDIS